MTDPRSAALGGHALPPFFSDPGRTTPRRRRTGLILGLVSGAVVVAALGAVQLGANLRYDEAADKYRATAQSTGQSVDAVTEATEELTSATDAASLLISANTGVLIGADGTADLAAAIEQATTVTTDAEDTLSTEIEPAGEKPGWFWELFGASTQLDDERRDVDELGAELDSEAPKVAEATETVTETGVALLSAASEAAGPFETAHISAKNDAVIALRDAASAASAVTVIDSAAVDSFTALQAAADDVVASEKAELAEKAGPLLSARLEVEAFARSLAPGVLLEFDWNRIVNGVGEGGSMGGLTTWWWGGADRAVIELSDSVARQWPSYSSKSLVAHEVGHAISVKCEDMYDSSTQDSIEKWATAWAISMGYTDDANGVWAYGYPPQSYIDAAAGCR